MPRRVRPRLSAARLCRRASRERRTHRATAQLAQDVRKLSPLLSQPQAAPSSAGRPDRGAVLPRGVRPDCGRRLYRGADHEDAFQHFTTTCECSASLSNIDDQRPISGFGFALWNNFKGRIVAGVLTCGPTACADISAVQRRRSAARKRPFAQKRFERT